VFARYFLFGKHNLFDKYIMFGIMFFSNKNKIQESKMDYREHSAYLLGYIKASIEYLCSIASKDRSSELFELLVDLEQYFNQEIKKLGYNQ
jgi:hypothetical protein